MECREIDLEASPLAAEGEVDRTVEGGRIVTCEIEVAEALVGLAGCRTSRDCGELGRPSFAEAAGTSLRPSQDPPEVTQQLHDYTSTGIMSSEKIPSQLCSTSQYNTMSKSRPKLTEAEKEERKFRRIMANRESARQTIRRRKAMHLELTRKAAGVLEENEVLKKEMELMVDEYNSLKDVNRLLKEKLAKIKHQAEQGEMQGPTTSSAENPFPAPTNTPIFLPNQPSVVPCFWPSILPSSDIFQFQCTSSSNGMRSSPFPIPYTGMPCSQQGHENSSEINRQGSPLFVVAVPCLLPFLAHSGIDDTLQNAHLSMLQEDNHQLSSSRNMNAEASNSAKPNSAGGHHLRNLQVDNTLAPAIFTSGRSIENHRPTGNAQPDNPSGAGVSSTQDSIGHGLFHKIQEPTICPPKNAEDAFAATVARRRRKELMRLKNIHCNYNNLQSAAPG